MKSMSTNKIFQVGDWVRGNGSSFHPPRIYVGQVLEVHERSYDIVDNEWGATSEVRKDKVFAAEEAILGPRAYRVLRGKEHLRALEVNKGKTP